MQLAWINDREMVKCCERSNSAPCECKNERVEEGDRELDWVAKYRLQSFDFFKYLV